MVQNTDPAGNPTTGGINWDAFFNNTQRGADIFEQLFTTVNGPRPQGQPMQTSGSGMPSFIIWGAVAVVILATLWLIFKK